jgi:hypothetical protein
VSSKNGKDVNLIDDLCKSTLVVKTRKRLGYHIYWLSHNQNKSIRTSDCREGCEFEIKTDNSTGHSTLPPSRHRDDVDFRYQNVGQNAIAVNDKLYEDLVDLLSDFIKENPSLNGSINDISSNEGFQVALILSSVYRNGNINDIKFALSGFLRHGEYSLNATETIVNQLCQMTDDEEIENRLVVVRKTYDNNGKPITGRNELFEILERAVGLEAASQIINGIPQLLDKKRDPVVSQ